MNHIMIDLETLSTLPNARMIAIGAVKFSIERGVYANFYTAITPPPLDAAQNFIDDEGFHISKDTLAWWKQQSPEANAVMHDHLAVSMDDALGMFTMWATEDTRVEDICMWGNGASFDNVILSSAYRIRNLEQPWRFWNDRCYRTIHRMHKDVAVERIGLHHNAVDDAETQARHLLKLPVNLG
jgi:exodeoxyribonuclease VIII